MPGYFYGTDPNDFLRENVRIIKNGGDILCLAEGEGRNAVFLAKQGFNVTAVDMSDVGLKKLNELAASQGVNVKTLCANLETFKINTEAWDGIVSIWCHLPGPLREKLYQDCVQGLRPGGVMLIEAYTPDQIPLKTGGPQDPDLLPRFDDLKRELRGLRIQIGRELKREIHEGTGHSGMSAVVQFIGAKPLSA